MLKVTNDVAQIDDREMDPARRALLRWSSVAGIGALGMLAASTGHAAPEAGQAQTALSDQEKAAVALVSDFLAAWPSRDVARIASFVADDLLFKGTPNDPEIKGKDGFMKETARFMALPFVAQLDFASGPKTIHASGGPSGTTVMALRIDTFKGTAGSVSVPLVGIFWIVGDKIKQWYDFPLVNNLGPGEGQSW